MDSGLKQALIRMKNARPIDLNTAYYANTLLGFLAYAFIYSIAPLVADFYSNPVLVNLIRAASIGILISSFQGVRTALLSRQLNFKIQLKTTLPAGLISALAALAAAAGGWGVWALIVQMLTSAAITSWMLCRQVDWSPGWAFSRRSFMRMYQFSYKLFLSGVLDKIFSNIYVVVIAKFFSASAAGFYFFSEKIRDAVITQIISAIQTVTYPALASIQNENERLKKAYRRILKITTFLFFCVMILLIALSELVIQVVFPPKWWPAADYMQLLCTAGLLYPLHSLNLNIIKIKGRSDLFLKLEIIKKLMVIPAIIVGLQYGIKALMLMQILVSVVSYFPNAKYSRDLIDYSIPSQIKDVAPGFLIALAAGLPVWLAQHFLAFNILAELMGLLLLGGLMVYCLARIFRLDAYMDIRDIVLNRGKFQ
jgi:O-antigen/teichoic acid export membrane protein